MFSLKKLASEADLKFIVTSDYIVEVFSVGVEHAATANNRQVVAAGFVPFKKILDHLAERPDFSEIFLGGIRWRSVSLSIATPVAMQKPLLDFFVQVRDEIYPS